MIRSSLIAAVLALLGVLPMQAQESSLVDLRAGLSTLRSELQSLRSELVASGAEGFQAAGGDAAIDRMNAMERHLMQLTDRTEQLQNRINRIVEDGTRRIGDIEFRLCELDETCNLGDLATPELGGLGSGAAMSPYISPSAPALPDGNGAAATASEQADFDAANAALGEGDFSRAAQLFGAVAEDHAGGPLTAEALYLRGAALDSGGDPKAAASAWLEGFAAEPDGPRAGESLLGIARVVAVDGDSVAACLYLAEIPARFPGSASAAEAERRMLVLNCGGEDLGSGPDDSMLDPEAAADLAEFQ